MKRKRTNGRTRIVTFVIDAVLVNLDGENFRSPKTNAVGEKVQFTSGPNQNHQGPGDDEKSENDLEGETEMVSGHGREKYERKSDGRIKRQTAPHAIETFSTHSEDGRNLEEISKF